MKSLDSNRVELATHLVVRESTARSPGEGQARPEWQRPSRDQAKGPVEPGNTVLLAGAGKSSIIAHNG